MRDKLFVIILIVFVSISCSEEDLPEGIYDYQIERLLSGQTGSKIWSQVSSNTNCADSIKLIFTLVADSSNDSLDISLERGCSGSSTTTLIGRADASHITDGVLFTDSLLFTNGNYWIVDEITSEQLLLNIDDQQTFFQVE